MMDSNIWLRSKVKVVRYFLSVVIMGSCLYSYSAPKSIKEYKMAVLHNQEGSWGFEYDIAEYLGITLEKFSSTSEDMERFIKKINDFDFVLVAPLFNRLPTAEMETDLTVYGPAFKRFIENGGAVMIVDANYYCVITWLSSIDPTMNLIINDGCGVKTEFTNPVDPIWTMPEKQSEAGSWTHFDVPQGSNWKVIEECLHEQKDADTIRHSKTVVQHFGKGMIYITGCRPNLARFFVNFYTNLELFRAGFQAEYYTAPQAKAGDEKVILKVKNVRGKQERVRLEMTITMLPKLVKGKEKGEWNYWSDPTKVFKFQKEAFLEPNKLGTIELPYNAPRGPLNIKVVLRHAQGEFLISEKRYFVPDLLTISPPRYRGMLSEFRRGEDVGVVTEIMPNKERMEQLSIRMAIQDSSGKTITGSSQKFPAKAGYSLNKVPFSKKLPVGRYTIKAALINNMSNPPAPIAVDEKHFRVIKYVEGQVIVDEDLTLLVDGKPFFPLGFYHVPDSDHEQLASLGFNTVHVWSWQTAAFDNAHKYGLKVLYEMGGDRFDFNHIAHVLGDQINNHPALMLRYTMDEPNETHFDMTSQLNELLGIVDINHPTYLVSNNMKLLDDHIKLTDIIASDPYPYWYDNSSIVQVGDWVDVLYNATHTNKSAICVPQSYGHEDLGALRAMAYLAITHEARGLIWYAWKEVGGRSPGHGTFEYPEHQATLKAVVSEIKKLTPALLNTGRSQFLAGPKYSEVHGLFCKDPDGANYVVMVNPWPYDKTVKVKDARLLNVNSIRNTFGTDTIKVFNSEFEISFPRYSTAVYQW